VDGTSKINNAETNPNMPIINTKPRKT